MISPFRAALGLSGWAHHAAFQRATAQPERAQAAVLRRLLRKHAGTAFGREHGFGDIATPAGYARRVPLRDYEAFRPYVDRIAAGEARVLTADPVIMFTTTSGTAAAPKLVPVTARWRAETASLTRLWMLRAMRDHPDAFDGKVLTVVSPAIEGVTSGGVPCGAMSGVVYQGIPPLLRRQYAVPYPVCLIRDCERRYFVTMRLALARNVTAVGTPNPTTLLRLAEVAAVCPEALVRAIHDGTLGVPRPAVLDVPGGPGRDALDGVETALRPDPARARALARLVERAGTLRPRDCWPDLALIGCWLGGSAGVHARHLADAYGAVPLRDLGLLASEGRMTIPLEDGTPGGVLAVHTGFFEFVPEEERESRAPTVQLAHELEPGRRYAIVLTGGNGLYRYDIDDIVEVQGLYRRTPVLAFIRKGRDMVSITGEKLHVHQVLAAVREAEDETKLGTWQVRLIPDVEARRYDLLVELRDPGGPDPRPEAFLRAFDAALSRLNVEYRAKRGSRRLRAPRLRVMRPGWGERQSRADVAAGKREAQYKWPALRFEWDPASRTEVVQTLELGEEPPAVRAG